MSDKQFPPPEKTQPSGDGQPDSEDVLRPEVDDTVAAPDEVQSGQGTEPEADTEPVAVDAAEHENPDESDDAAARELAEQTHPDTEHPVGAQAGSTESWRDDRTMLSVLGGGIALGAIILAGVVGFAAGQESTGKADGVCQSVSVWGDGDKYRELDTQGADTRAKFELRFEQGSTSACVGGVVDGAPTGLAGLLPMTGQAGVPVPSTTQPEDIPGLLEENGIEVPAELQPLVEQFSQSTTTG